MRKIFVLDKGYVQLLNVSGPVRRADADFDAHDRDPANAARLSFDAAGTRDLAADLKLNRYLLDHEHMSPFEMVEVWFEMKMPIFVARQFIRHRTASVNEVSRRYVDDEPELYVPSVWRGKAASNKQGSSGEVDYEGEPYRVANLVALSAYHDMLDNGVCPEQARMVLPVSMYTKWLWKQDLRNLMHLLRLRLDEHAQWECREYAHAMQALLRNVLPSVMGLIDA